MSHSMRSSSLVGSRARRSITPGKVAAWAVVIVLIVITIFPFYWAIRTALSTQSQLFTHPRTLLPVGFTLGNFEAALGLISKEESIARGGSGRTFDFWRYLGNTVLVSGMVAIGQVFFSAMAAYALARLHFPGRNLIFLCYVASLMIPGIVLLIPNFVLISDLGWLNTYQGIMAPALLMSPFAVFFLRQFFLGINGDLEDAARIDGAGYLQIFTRIILPLSWGPLLTLGIIVLVYQWNSYLWPLLVGRAESVRTLTVALSVFRSQTPAGSPDWPGLMAGTLLAGVPIFFIFLLLGRRISESIQFTGVK